MLKKTQIFLKIYFIFVNFYKMTKLSHLEKSKKPFYFSRKELAIILSTYSKKVSNGDWRDYALDNSSEAASFSIYRHAHETPVLVIEKRRLRTASMPLFLLHDRHKIISKSNSLEKVINYLNNMPKLVYSR